MTDSNEAGSEGAVIKNRRSRKLLKVIALAVIIVVVLVWLGMWLHHKLTHVSVSDAQVASHVITVSSRLDGRVTHFDLIKGDTLTQGQPIATLYSKPERLKLDQINADITRIKTQLQLAGQQIVGGVQAAKARLEADKSAVKAARARMNEAHGNYVRAEQLYKAHGGSEQQRDTYLYNYQSTRADYKRAQSQIQLDKVDIANARTGLLPIGKIANPGVLKTQLKIALAKRAHQQNLIRDMTVKSPINGVVDQTFIEQDEYISAGQPVLMMHNPGDVWVSARVKETTISKLAVGQPVDIHVDAYPDDTFKGHIKVIGQAATNQFALLPNPNPSGNFTKITQRIPVRITIDKGPKKKLAPGMMVEADIDITGNGDADSNSDHS